VKDWTSSTTKKNISGVVTSINTTLGSFTLLNNSSTTTVQTSSSTSFTLNGMSGTFASVFLNAKVKVAGMLNASSTIVSATSVDIASSTKKSWDKDDKKEWRSWIRSKVWLNVGH